METLQLELLIRGIAVGGNLLLAAVFLARPLWTIGRFVAGMFALGVAAYAVLSYPGIVIVREPWLLLLLPFAAGNNALLWLIARVQFEEGFKPSLRHLAVWIVLVALSLIRVGLMLESDFPQTWWLKLPHAALSAVLIGWALYAAMRDFSADMVEKRRIARIVFVAAIAIYAGIILTVELAWGSEVPAWTSMLNAAMLAIATLAFGVTFLDETFSRFFDPVVSGPKPREAHQERYPADSSPSPRARQVIALIEGEKLYREAGLSIGTLAGRLKVHEHRLRATINAELGFRNFNTFLNGYRLAECKAALADPAQAEVPIITIALDSGFQSMATFNRVFKAETGLSPSEYRKKALP